jgi:DNA-binding NarL/FixJ family response regulator
MVDLGLGTVIRLGIVDDHPVFRLGLRRTFERENDLQVVWDLAAASGLAPKLAASPVDVVLMDLDLGPGQDSLGATRAIVGGPGNVKVIVISASLDTDAVTAARLAGASGFLPKDLPVDKVIEAVRALGAKGKGRPAFADFVSRRPEMHGSGTLTDGLTRREHQVLAELRRGCTNREIAARLGVSVPTVNKHVQQVLKKLRVKNRGQAVASAYAEAASRLYGG